MSGFLLSSLADAAPAPDHSHRIIQGRRPSVQRYGAIIVQHRVPLDLLAVATSSERGGGSRSMRRSDELVVCFNGSCPVCRAEIEHYRERAAGVPGVVFLDVATDPEGAARRGIVGDRGFRRLHAVDSSGAITSGIAVFTALWERVPGYSWLARLMAVPLVRDVADGLYEWIAAPLLYRLHLRRQRRRSGGG
jgi:predicted DCC family thiol-disulfide oxidoreductase YuxK